MRTPQLDVDLWRGPERCNSGPGVRKRRNAHDVPSSLTIDAVRDLFPMLYPTSQSSVTSSDEPRTRSVFIHLSQHAREWAPHWSAHFWCETPMRLGGDRQCWRFSLHALIDESQGFDFLGFHHHLVESWKWRGRYYLNK